MFKKRTKHIPKKGIMGPATDYTIYSMSLIEKAVSYALAFVAVFIVLQVMFDVLIVGLIAGVIIGFAGIPIANSILLERRRTALLLQFKDMLEALSTSIGVGKNVTDAFTDAQQDMLNQYGEKSYIHIELSTIIAGLHNNIVIEELLENFAERSGLEDVISFSDIFAVCNRQGGNLKEIIYESKNMISDKIEIEMEIKTLVSGKKNELNIMTLMPLLIVFSLRGFGGDGGFADLNATNIIVKCAALVAFVIAYVIGSKIVKIRA